MAIFCSTTVFIYVLVSLSTLIFESCKKLKSCVFFSLGLKLVKIKLLKHLILFLTDKFVLLKKKKT